MNTQTILIILLVWTIVGLFAAIKFGEAARKMDKGETSDVFDKKQQV